MGMRSGQSCSVRLHDDAMTAGILFVPWATVAYGHKRKLIVTFVFCNERS